MICYRDMTFCNNQHCTCPEWRRLTDKVVAEARAWWGGDGAPIAVGDVCGEVPGLFGVGDLPSRKPRPQKGSVPDYGYYLKIKEGPR